MTTRGLPGFLRRSLRRDDYYTTSEDEDDDSDSEYEDEDNSLAECTNSCNGIDAMKGNKTESEEGDNITKTEKSHTSSLLDPSPLAETADREDSVSGWTNAADTALPSSPVSDRKGDFDDQISMSSLGESESGKDAIHSQTKFSGESSVTNHNSRSSKRFSINRSYREIQFEKVLGTDDEDDINKISNSNHVVKMSELRKIAWNGVPPQYRGMCWKILLGYLPTNAMRRQQTLERKRAEYKDAIQQHYYIDDNSRTIQEQETLRQVLVDVPRTAPDVPLFRNEKIKRALSRLLYIWAMRHPASSYVQGINDLATPLFAVFLADDYEGEDVLDGSVMVVLEEERLNEVRFVLYI